MNLHICYISDIMYIIIDFLDIYSLMKLREVNYMMKKYSENLIFCEKKWSEYDIFLYLKNYFINDIFDQNILNKIISPDFILSKYTSEEIINKCLINFQIEHLYIIEYLQNITLCSGFEVSIIFSLNPNITKCLVHKINNLYHDFDYDTFLFSMKNDQNFNLFCEYWNVENFIDKVTSCAPHFCDVESFVKLLSLFPEQFINKYQGHYYDNYDIFKKMVNIGHRPTIENLESTIYNNHKKMLCYHILNF